MRGRAGAVAPACAESSRAAGVAVFLIAMVDIDSASAPEVRCRLQIAAVEDRKVTVRVTAAGKSAAETLEVRAGQGAPRRAIQPQRQRALRSLHELVATVEEGGTAIDRVVEKFGIRKVEVSGRQILLSPPGRLREEPQTPRLRSERPRPAEYQSMLGLGRS